MAYWKSPAICLRVVEYGETSQIAAFLSRERGRVSTIAKGARRKGSRFAGALEPIQLCEIVCVKGREGASLHTLAELDVLETFRGARSELRRLNAAAYVIEVLREAAPEEQPLPEVFDLALVTLRKVAGAQPFDPLAVHAFQARLLELMGLFPRLDACAECGAGVRHPGGRISFSGAKGGVLCNACQGVSACEVSAGTIEALGQLGRNPDRAACLRLTASQMRELRGVLDATLGAALDRELRLSKRLE